MRELMSCFHTFLRRGNAFLIKFKVLLAIAMHPIPYFILMILF